MFKKIILLIALFIPLTAFADFNDIYILDIKYDWINKSVLEKEAIIEGVHDIIFETPLEKIPDFKKQYKEHLKDKNHIEHYYAASAGYKEYKGFNISAFYFRNMKNIYMYAIQDKKDVSKAYYYDALGHLKYIDFIKGEYPDFPYYAIQYSISGKPISAIYYVSKDTQYMFNPDESFKGVWFKHNMYDEHSKVILKRTTY